MEERYNNKKNVIFNPDKVQRWNEEKNTIISTTPNHIDQLCKPFLYLRKTASEGYSKFSEVEEAQVMARKENLARVKKLEMEKKAGYVTFSTLIVLGTVVVGMIIFGIIGSIVR